MKAVKPYVKQHMKLEPKEKLEEKSRDVWERNFFQQ
jgi:hypothetical protein